MKLLSITYDFSCRFDFSKALFEFEGHKFLFHAGGNERHTVIETYLQDDQDVDEVINIANKFCLSMLDCSFVSFQFKYASVLGGIPKGSILFDRDPFNQTKPKSTMLRRKFPSQIRPSVTEDQARAFSLYNDFLYTENLPLKIICLWKIFEIPSARGHSPKNRVNEILDKNPSIADKHSLLTELHGQGKDIGQYMKKRFRNAVAHISRPPHFSSYRFEDWVELKEASNALSDIASTYLKDDIGLPSPQGLDVIRVTK